MNYYFDAIKNYMNFKGRASRKQFWMFILMNFAVSFLLVALGAFLGQLGYLIAYLYPFAMLIPIYSLSARRLHDTNKSAWFLICYFIPFGGLVLFALFLFKGDASENKYGPAIA